MTHATSESTIPGISGLGPVGLTVALVLFFVALDGRLETDYEITRAELVSRTA